MCGPAVKEKPCRRAIWLLFARTYRTSGLADGPAHRGLKIYAALTWDRGFELLHRAQRHTNPIDPRPRLDASAYLGRARRHADQLSWNWIRVVHTLRWCRGDLEHSAQPTTEARRSRWPKPSQSSGSITSGFECEISTALWAFTGCLGLLWCAAPRATMSRSFATSTEWSSISCSTPMPAIRPSTF